MAETKKPNTLHYGDCLDILRGMEAECVDLIYLDPPFNSKVNYNMLFGTEKGEDQAQVSAFSDTWYWRPDHEDLYDSFLARGGTLGRTTEALIMILGRCGMLAYLLFMMERLIELKRVLKKTGSIYLHCDPTASHYLKIIMDAVFGANMFRNEVIWKRTTSHNDAGTMGSIHDVIFFFTTSQKNTWNQQCLPYDKAYIRQRFTNSDPDGRLWMDGDITAKGLSGGGYEYEYRGKHSLWRVPLERMKELDKQNRLYFTSRGGIRIKRYLDEMKGVPLNDVWTDIQPINSQARERLGYPTQKPLALLERIVKASSNEGDVVLDPFCGCGTTIDAAQALGRRWIGIDVSTLAINVVLERLMDVHGEGIINSVDIHGSPRDVPGAQTLFNRNPFEFERWAVGLLRGRPNDRQVGDGGSDGTLRFPGPNRDRPQRGIISVKGGKSVNPGMVRDLHGTVEKDRAQMGVLVTLAEPTKGMVETANTYGLWEDEFTKAKFPKIQIITIEELLAGTMPKMPTPLSPYVKAEYSHADTRQSELL